jgi:hypothetical protein
MESGRPCTNAMKGLWLEPPSDPVRFSALGEVGRVAQVMISATTGHIVNVSQPWPWLDVGSGPHSPGSRVLEG